MEMITEFILSSYSFCLIASHMLFLQIIQIILMFYILYLPVSILLFDTLPPLRKDENCTTVMVMYFLLLVLVPLLMMEVQVLLPLCLLKEFLLCTVNLAHCR